MGANDALILAQLYGKILVLRGGTVKQRKGHNQFLFIFYAFPNKNPVRTTTVNVLVSEVCS